MDRSFIEPIQVFNCRECSACCGGWEIAVCDEDEQVPKGLVTGPLHVKTMKMKYLPSLKHQYCIALEGIPGNGISGCNIYQNRPVLCRRFMPGSEACLEARKRVFPHAQEI